jgi:predicted DNA-binding transcriptional regulator AlpA
VQKEHTHQYNFPVPPAVIQTEIREVPVFTQAQMGWLTVVDQDLDKITEQFKTANNILAELNERAKEVQRLAVAARESEQKHRVYIDKASKQGSVSDKQYSKTGAPQESTETIPITPGMKKVASAVIQFQDHGLNRQQISTITGLARSTRDKYIGQLASIGLVQENGNGKFYPTPMAIGVLPDLETLPSGIELINYWRSVLKSGHKNIFEVCLGAGDRWVAREEISERTKLARSTRDKYISELEARYLLESDGRGNVRVNPTLWGIGG